MELVALDDQGNLYLSPDIDDWQQVSEAGITAIIDLDGGLDLGVPMIPNHILYLYFPFNDSDLPELTKLHALARFAASLIRCGHRVLSHCGLGYNRSALVAGLILRYLGMSGREAVEHIRQRRPGALYNETYYEYVVNCQIEG